MKKIGIIDVGSNSMRLVIYEVSSTNTFIPIEDVKEGVRLGEDVNKTRLIKENKLELAYKTLVLFKEICDKNSVDEIIAFGTAAIRVAVNAQELLDMVKQELGIDIQIFAAAQEAYFSFLGAINSLNIEEGVMMDMGGASTELVWFKHRHIHKWVSLNFGSVTIGELGNLKDILKEKDEKKIRQQIKDELKNVSWFREIKNLTLIGVGGIIRNIASIHHNLIDYPLDSLHGYHMTLENITEVFNLVKTKSYEEKLEIEGLSKSRADIFIGAVMAVEEILEYGNLKNIIISGCGIREGVLYKRLSEFGRELDNVFENSLNSSIELYKVNKSSREVVYQNFKKIFKRLAYIHNIKELNEKALLTACYLGKVGIGINFYNYELHSSYIILNSGIKGMSHNEIVLAALMLIDHNKFPHFVKRYYPLLTDKEKEYLPAIAKILSLAENFNKMLLTPIDFEVELTEKRIIFYIRKTDLLDIEISKMFISKRRFKEIFGRGIEIKRC
jgi:exopolyphosphatase/guanosine-5'-triphosphate,3'-diphosphate pyrophosphatase